MGKADDYQTIIVESFIPESTAGRHGPVHIRPLPGQVFPSTLFVSCSKRLMDPHRYKVGTKFKLQAKLTDRLGGTQFLYANPKDPDVVVSEAEARAFLRKQPDSSPVVNKSTLKSRLRKRDFRSFAKAFDGAWEQREVKGQQERENFVRRYPRRRIADIKLRDYAIGVEPRAGFCYWAEAGSRNWASMQGGNAMKFGIYYGPFGENSDRQYRFKAAYGPPDGSPAAAFRSVKSDLLALLTAGQRRNFDAIDKNRLPQVFKAKLLSLYYPNVYINICSERALEHFAQVLGVKAIGCAATQYELLRSKMNHAPADWSTWKFTRFLFHTYPFQDAAAETPPRRAVASGKPTSHEPDFEQLQKLLRAMGEKSEAFAKQWEENRLAGIGLRHRVISRAKTPRYGYDLESVVDGNPVRRIEVKTARSRAAVGYRFFVTGHELRTSHVLDHYWFYFVEWNFQGPHRVHPVSAAELHKLDCLEPDGYIGHIQLHSTE